MKLLAALQKKKFAEWVNVHALRIAQPRVMSELAARLNSGDFTGALSVAYQDAKRCYPSLKMHELDKVAERLVVNAAEYTKFSRAFTRNPTPRRIHRTKIKRRRYVVRPSQITRRSPTKRLLSRRRRNLAAPRRGFFPNPDGVRIVHNRLLGGWFVVRGPHQTPISGNFPTKEAAQQSLIDAKNRRDGNTMRRNPSQTIRSIGRATPAARARYAAGQKRRRWSRVPDAPKIFYRVQVRRGKGWLSVAGFTNPNELGKRQAQSWAMDYAKRFPGRNVRVTWPDDPIKK